MTNYYFAQADWLEERLAKARGKVDALTSCLLARLLRQTRPPRP